MNTSIRAPDVHEILKWYASLANHELLRLNLKPSVILRVKSHSASSSFPQLTYSSLSIAYSGAIEAAEKDPTKQVFQDVFSEQKFPLVRPPVAPSSLGRS